MKTICFDFDGVIHQYSKGWHDGTIYDPPAPEVLKAIRWYQEKGHPVVICTCRCPRQVHAWMQEHAPDIMTCYHTAAMMCRFFEDPLFWDNTEVVLVTRIKPSAAVYIDDRAVQYTGSWAHMSLRIDALIRVDNPEPEETC